MTDGVTIETARLERDREGFVPMKARMKETAADEGIKLTFRDGVWIAEDIRTGSRASDVSIPSAWAMAVGTGVHDVLDTLSEAGCTPVQSKDWLAPVTEHE